MDTTITIDQLEALATEMTVEVEVQHARLARLCATYGRIIAAREPQTYKLRACHHGDVAGHWDNSYPPRQVYSDHSGPRSIEITTEQTEDVATSGGFYFSWRRVTTAPGLYLGRDGQWYRSSETGSGRLGAFAAHPGNVGVDCEIEYEECHADDLSVAELELAEQVLRDLAFPLIAARRAAQQVRS